MTRRGAFIVVEGVDGCGKTSQVKRIGDYLEDLLGPSQVVRTKDLGGSLLGECLREIMYHKVPPKDMARGVLDLIFLAGHVQNWHTLVEPALIEGKVVVSDRFFYSQMAYGPYRNAHPDAQEAYHRMHGGHANLLLFLSGDPKVLFDRANARSDAAVHQHRKAWNYVDVQENIRDEYRKLYSKLPEWCEVAVDKMTEEQVWTVVKWHVDKLLMERGVGPELLREKDIGTT